jgi:NDP-sugar pyrophosphorylase family protein
VIPTVEELFDLAHCPWPAVFDSASEPWLALSRISAAVDAVVESRPGFYTEHRPGVFVGPRTTIAASACLEGPAVIGADCEIRHGAFVRNDVIVGDGCVIGNSTELKNCVLFDGVQVPHFNYVGDSILGYRAHLGAGVILSNVRLDGVIVRVHDTDDKTAGSRRAPGAGNGTPAADAARSSVGRRRVDTGLLKFGALIGDHVEIGCNSVLNPGTIVGRGAVIYPLSVVRGVVREGAVITGDAPGGPPHTGRPQE